MDYKKLDCSFRNYTAAAFLAGVLSQAGEIIVPSITELSSVLSHADAVWEDEMLDTDEYCRRASAVLKMEFGVEDE